MTPLNVWEWSERQIQQAELQTMMWTSTSNTHSLHKGYKIYDHFDCKTEHNIALNFQVSLTILPVGTLFWCTIPHL